MTENADRRALALNGVEIAAAIRREVSDEIARLQSEHGVRAGLVVVRVGDDPASEVYVRNKVRTSEEMGLYSEQRALPASTSTAELLELINSLNRRDDIDGILVQLPLPRAIDESRVLEAVDPAKDVDGFHPQNVGRLVLNQPTLVPCTPAGVMEMLTRSGVTISGARACVVGRSNIVGRPLAQLLLQKDATVTICHSRTRDLADITRQADILVAAIGRAGLIRGEFIKPGATVIDIGMNKVTDEATVREMFADAEKRLEVVSRRGYTLVGDVFPKEAEQVAGRLTPVPGGVGPLTIAMLMRNTVTAARRRRGLDTEENGKG